jgi:hypothetical protein
MKGAGNDLAEAKQIEGPPRKKAAPQRSARTTDQGRPNAMFRITAVAELFNDAICKAYWDSLEVFFPLFPGFPRQRLRWYGRLQPVRRGRQGLIGWRLIINRPNPEQLPRLDTLCRNYHGIICRLDLAVDFKTEKPELIQQLLIRGLVLRWSRENAMCQLEEDGRITTYWVEIRPGKRRTRRNLVLYLREFDCIAGTSDLVVHAELRFLRAQSVRQQGILQPSDLIGKSSNELFEKHVKYTDAADKLEQTFLRKESNKARAKYAGKELSQLSDRYWSSLPRRCRQLLKVNGYDKAQNLRKHPMFKKGMENHTELLKVPEQLSWKIGGRRADEGRNRTAILETVQYSGIGRG